MCLKTANVSAWCRECGIYEEPCHLIEEETRPGEHPFYCEAHCPQHRPALFLDTPITPGRPPGTQGELF